MEREQVPLDSTFSRLICTCQSSSERDQLSHVFPRPMPDTHYLHFEWIDDMRFVIEPRVKPELAPIVEDQEYIVKREKLRQELSFKRVADLEVYAAEKNVKIDLATWRKLLPGQQVMFVVDQLMPPKEKGVEMPATVTSTDAANLRSSGVVAPKAEKKAGGK